MLYYDRTDVSEGININKCWCTSSKECIIFQYWYILDEGSKFQPDVCNGYHDVLMISMNFNNIAILNICDVDYRCIINGISYRKFIAKRWFNLKKWIIVKYIFSLSCIKDG